MKKMMLILACVFSFVACIKADNYQPVTRTQLPQKAQTFLSAHFADAKTSLMRRELDVMELNYDVIFTDGSREFGRYPLSVYGDAVLRFLTFVVPIALFLYYPLLTLLGRSESLLWRICPLFALLFLIPCYAVWRIGLLHYRSTGS